MFSYEELIGRKISFDQFIRFLYPLYRWFVFLPLFLITTTLLGFLTLILTPLFGHLVSSRICGRAWARASAAFTPMGVQVIGRKNIRQKQSYVVISNHESMFDILVLYGWLGIDFKWVMKQELRKVPVIGATCDLMGHIYIDRKNGVQAMASIKAARNRIAHGTSILFFPEGTRSLTGDLGPFKSGAFRIAIEMGLPILPVTICNTRNILPAKTLNLMPGKATMIIHAPIETKDFSQDTVKTLMHQTRSVIQNQKMHAQPDPKGFSLMHY